MVVKECKETEKLLISQLFVAILYDRKVGIVMAGKNKNNNKNTKRLLILGLTSIGIIVITTFTIGSYWLEIYEKYQERSELEEKLEYLQSREAVLRGDADRLQDPDYIARFARERYLFSKEGEIVLQIQ